MTPSWQPDPLERHHYRWWDGVDWSDHVSDFGVISIDDEPVPMVPPRRRPTGRADRWRLVPLAAAVGVAVVVTGVFVALFRDRSPAGLGVVTGEIGRRGSFEVELFLEAGDVLRVRAEPTAGLDVQLGVVVDRGLATEAATAIAEEHAGELVLRYPELGPARTIDRDQVRELLFPDAGVFFTGDAARDHGGGYLALGVDDGFDASFESGYLVAAADGAYTVVVGAVKGTGDVRVITERADEPYDDEQLVDDEAVAGDAFFTEEAFFVDDAPYGAD